MKKAQNADKGIDISSDVKGYKQAVDNLSASISACVGENLLSNVTDVAMAARELEGTMKAKLRKAIEKAEQMLRAAILTAKTTRKWAPLAAHVETLVSDEVLRQSCGDAVEGAENLLGTLQAEEQERMAAVGVCKILCN